MKKIIFIAILAFSMSAKAQVTLEATYDTASLNLYVVNLEISGKKYVKVKRNQNDRFIYLYNLNHTLWKKINCNSFSLGNDPMGNPSYDFDLLYITENLFDTDNEVEFMFCYNTGFDFYTGIYNEDGTPIFSQPDSWPGCRLNMPQQQVPIYNTINGTKMILSFPFTNEAKVYGLAGILTVDIAKDNEALLNQNYSNLKLSNPYPNPTINSTKIDYTLPDGVSQGEIVFYTIQGAEVKRFKVDRTFNNLLISTADIKAGTYYYQLQTATENSGGKKMVVIK